MTTTDDTDDKKGGMFDLTDTLRDKTSNLRDRVSDYDLGDRLESGKDRATNGFAELGSYLTGYPTTGDIIGFRVNEDVDPVRGGDYEAVEGVTRRGVLQGSAAALGVGVTGTYGAAQILGGEETSDGEYVESDGDIPSDARAFSEDDADDLLSPIMGDCSVDEVYGELLGETEVGYALHATELGDSDIDQLGPLEGDPDDEYSWLGISAEKAPVGKDGDALVMAKGRESTYEMSAGEVSSLLDEDTLDGYLEESGEEVGFVSNEVRCE